MEILWYLFEILKQNIYSFIYSCSTIQYKKKKKKKKLQFYWWQNGILVGLGSLFNGISTFVGYFMSKLSLWKNSSDTL